MPKPCLSVIIPAYESQNSLSELYSRLQATIADIELDFEVILLMMLAWAISGV